MPIGGRRVLIYSHDSFGLGHLRRCRTIANSLVRRDPHMSVLILSGSPIIGSFNFGRSVDFVRLPGVIKLRNGEYSSHSLRLRIEETVGLRAAIIRQTAETYDPDLFIVDKEPHGLRGEVLETLEMLASRGVRLVLGLRDIMDGPDLLGPEWRRKRVMPALRNLYHEIWVYGLPQVCDPLAGLRVPDAVRRKMVYAGYLRRQVPYRSSTRRPFDGRPYIFVTTGGGADGVEFLDWVLRAYETDSHLPPAFILYGPFLHRRHQNDFNSRIAQLPLTEAIDFDSQPELLMKGASGVLAMGGYNTFCEILSFDKRAVIVPRTRPRLEQFIRASRAQELGLVSMLPDDGQRDPHVMAAAIRGLSQQGLPSEVALPGLLDGLDNVTELADRQITVRRVPPLRVAAAG